MAKVKAKAKIPDFTQQMYQKLSSTFDKLQRDAGLTGGSDIAERMSTGLMVVDVILGGGIVGGSWITSFGPEKSAKSTLCMQIMISGVIHEVPILRAWDYEGSIGSDSVYLESQMKNNGLKMGFDDLFGARDPHGKTIKQGVVWYNSSGNLEDFFNVEASILRRLPDKRFVNGQWWFMFEDDKQGREMVQGKFNKAMKQQYGKLCMPAPDGKPQGLIICDSYPAMLPNSMDEDESKSGMALKARLFSEHIPKVASYLKQKKVTILGVNQLRLNPGVRYGSPEYEPCGEALKFISSVRLRIAARAVPHGKGPLEEEESIDGGTDTYEYKHIKATKNKFSTPNIEGWSRIWVSDSSGKGRGFDKVYDLGQYLASTGQIDGKRNKFKIAHPLFKGMKQISMLDFKKLVLGDKEQVNKVMRDSGIIKKNGKPFKIASIFRKQLDSGEGLKMFFETKNSDREDDEDDED